jgi:hypothetical protein
MATVCSKLKSGNNQKPGYFAEVFDPKLLFNKKCDSKDIPYCRPFVRNCILEDFSED